MKPTPITVTNYMGRPVNPHPKWFQGQNGLPISQSGIWEMFESEIKCHFCPSLANTEPGKTILAYLQWQFWAPNSLYPEWEDCDPNETWREEWCRGNGCKTRQIWVPIVEQKEGEGKPDFILGEEITFSQFEGHVIIYYNGQEIFTMDQTEINDLVKYLSSLTTNN